MEEVVMNKGKVASAFPDRAYIAKKDRLQSLSVLTRSSHTHATRLSVVSLSPTCGFARIARLAYVETLLSLLLCCSDLEESNGAS
jgi:hypothetical protein